MKRLIEYFDHAYIINLSDRADRRRQVEREFRRVGVEVSGSDKVSFYTAFRPSDSGSFEDVGTRGCFESHRGVLELALQNHFKNVLIFEDDVCFRYISEGFEQQLISLISGEAWDILYLGYGYPNDDGLTGPLLKWTNDIQGSHFYAVNGPFIETFFNYMNACEQRPHGHPEGGPMPADGITNHLRLVVPRVNLLLSVPNLAHQRSSRTDIAARPIFDDLSWLRPVVNGIRATKHQLRMARDRKKISPKMDKY